MWDYSKEYSFMSNEDIINGFERCVCYIYVRLYFSVLTPTFIIDEEEMKHSLTHLSSLPPSSPPVFGHQRGGGHRGDGRSPRVDIRPAG